MQGYISQDKLFDNNAQAFLALMDKDVFIVIPAYNEAQAIRQTLASLMALRYSIVVVDDGSTDDTYEQASRFPVYVLRHAINLGQGAALQTGTTFALRRGAHAIVHFDADGQHLPESIGPLLAPIRAQQADIVLGSRFLGEQCGVGVPRLKRWVLRCGRVFTGLTTGMWLTDAHNGLRALSETAARTIHIHENGMAHASEIIGLVRKYRFRYVEVPTKVVYTEYSKRKGQSALNALNIIIDLFFRRIFQ